MVGLPHYCGSELASDKHAVRLHNKHSNDWGVGGCCECNATNTHQKNFIDLHKAIEVPQLTNGDNVAYLTIGIALGVETCHANLNKQSKLCGRPSFN